MGITENAFCMMFDVWLSLRMISYFGEEHSGGISAQIQIKSKKSRDSVGEREFQSCFQSRCHSGLIFKVTVRMHH